MQRWVELKDGAPAGIATPEDAVTIAVSKIGSKDIRPKHPNPSHFMRRRPPPGHELARPAGSTAPPSGTVGALPPTSRSLQPVDSARGGSHRRGTAKTCPGRHRRQT